MGLVYIQGHGQHFVRRWIRADRLAACLHRARLRSVGCSAKPSVPKCLSRPVRSRHQPARDGLITLVTAARAFVSGPLRWVWPRVSIEQAVPDTMPD
jgi:hypothetical protein